MKTHTTFMQSCIAALAFCWLVLPAQAGVCGDTSPIESKEAKPSVEEGRTVQIRMQFVQVDAGAAEQPSSLPVEETASEQEEREDRRSDADAPELHHKEGPHQDGFHVVTNRKDGVLCLGGVNVCLREGEVRLPDNDARKPSAVRVLSAPTMVVRVRHEAAMTMGERVAYMVKREDGSLVVEHSEDVMEGIGVKLLVDRVQGEVVDFKKLSVRISTVVGRQDIPGVPFDVGRPMIRSTEITSAFRLTVGHTVAIAVPKAAAASASIYLVLSVELP